MNSNYLNQRILVIGLGLSGRSAVRFLIRQGALVVGVDHDQNHLENHPEVQNLKQAGMEARSDQERFGFENIALVILSPGVPSTHPLVLEALRNGIEVIGEIELGCRHINNPILGVTGTNGKTTTTLLIAHVLNACGISAKALGNVGSPFTQEIMDLDPADVIVLELSSYQLETLQQKVLDAALLLNITPDHLDRYRDMEEYAAAKCRMQLCLKAGGALVIESHTSHAYQHLLQKTPILTYGYAADLPLYSDLKSVYHCGQKVFDLPSSIAGRSHHDLENAMGAYALCASRGVTGSQFIQAFQTFQKPAHRIEFVLEHDGVKYYDDSKGTNIDAVIRAVESLDGPIILIAGGVDKGAAYTPWIKAFKGKVKGILAIGQAADKICKGLGERFSVEIINDLEQAVARAAVLAEKGDTILLSPGCASFDMFKDYAHRGEVFQRAVRTIAGD